MGVDLYAGMYPKKVVDKDTLLYLNRDCEIEYNGKHMPEGFYDACRQYGTKYDYPNPKCYVFEDENLQKFLTDNRVPDNLWNLYVYSIERNENVLIIWVC